MACREKDGEVGRKRHHGSEVCTNVAHHLTMLFLIQLKSTKPRDKKPLYTNNSEIILKYIIVMLLDQKQSHVAKLFIHSDNK